MLLRSGPSGVYYLCKCMPVVGESPSVVLSEVAYRCRVGTSWSDDRYQQTTHLPPGVHYQSPGRGCVRWCIECRMAAVVFNRELTSVLSVHLPVENVKRSVDF